MDDSDIDDRIMQCLRSALYKMRSASNFQENVYSSLDIYDPPYDKRTNFEARAINFIDNIVLKSSPYLANIETAAYITTTCKFLLVHSILFRLLIANIMRVKEQFNVRFENRAQLKSVPAQDAKQLQTLEQQRSYIRERSPNQIFHEEMVLDENHHKNYGEAVKRDETLLKIDYKLGRREGDTVFINLPVMADELSRRTFINCVYILASQLVRHTLIFDTPLRKMTLPELPEIIACGIMCEWRHRDSEDMKVFMKTNTSIFNRTPQIPFLAPLMTSERAEGFLQRIADLAFQVDFYSNFDGDFLVDGELRNNDYAKRTLDELECSGGTIASPDLKCLPWSIRLYRSKQSDIEHRLMHLFDDGLRFKTLKFNKGPPKYVFRRVRIQ